MYQSNIQIHKFKFEFKFILPNIFAFEKWSTNIKILVVADHFVSYIFLYFLSILLFLFDFMCLVLFRSSNHLLHISYTTFFQFSRVCAYREQESVFVVCSTLFYSILYTIFTLLAIFFLFHLLGYKLIIIGCLSVCVLCGVRYTHVLVLK